MSGTTQMAEIKTVVLVHGAFADGSCYAKRMKATTLTLASSHVPMMSQPDRVADFILKATLNANSHIDETQAAAR